nr:MAG TPA: hypothetical protein [Caudoviricetes sp.]
MLQNVCLSSLNKEMLYANKIIVNQENKIIISKEGNALCDI